MRNLRRIDVLLNEETGERFSENDLVQIKTYGTFSRELMGIINWIDTLELGIDTSKEYNCRQEQVKLEDIGSIVKIKK
ncbi:hypothetical protein KQI61_05705 [Anaerocolumna aminovalerica]|uniref:hypothetical protein n=1 Tax=Anaerocolumna aminovalerica TaxID=1527 RepID=UPI001C0ECB0D|nr:hypothetical protein [Anaerocolumna aminovalerica]MBU5331685.1 hypothetical protein [Anaerocolumna aminovalerica]